MQLSTRSWALEMCLVGEGPRQLPCVWREAGWSNKNFEQVRGVEFDTSS